MVIDTFLTIGKTHKICEDYIISGTTPMPFIILSDGCSSSKGTDMGARLLCCLAKQYLKFRSEGIKSSFKPDHKEMGLWIIHNAELSAKQLGLPKNSLDATLIIAYQNDPENIRVHVYGDGCIVKFKNNGDYEFTEIDYSKNAPYYLSYLIDPERHILYNEMGQVKKETTWFVEAKLDSTSNGYPYIWDSVYDFNINSMKGLLLTSDGFRSFVETNKGLVSFLKYTPDFFNFKTTAGEFLKRRATIALRNLAKQDIENADDLSIGVFLKEDKE